MKKYTAKDFDKIRKLFKKCEENKVIVANKVIDELIFLTNTLDELKFHVINEGCIVDMQQGNYSIERENPALKSYNATIKSYQNLLKQLFELATDEDSKEIEDELEKFIRNE